MSDKAQRSKSKKDDWQTPDRVLDPIREHDHIDLDPCAAQVNGYADTNVGPAADGLSHEWDGVVVMNPPFSEKVTWMRKAVGEYMAGNAERVYIISPASPDVQEWWHALIAPYTTCSWFPKGRVKYLDEHGVQQGSPSFGTAVSVLGTPPGGVLSEMDSDGEVVYRNVGRWLP